jgi:hypothetical protein
MPTGIVTASAIPFSDIDLLVLGAWNVPYVIAFRLVADGFQLDAAKQLKIRWKKRSGRHVWWIREYGERPNDPKNRSHLCTKRWTLKGTSDNHPGTRVVTHRIPNPEGREP